MPIVWKYYSLLFEWHAKNVKIDSPISVLTLQLKEAIEIMLQTTVYYYYGGSQSNFIKWINSNSSENSDDTVILAESIKYVSLFCHFLSIDCICLGVLWMLYLFKYQVFHGSFFRYLLFVVDFIFDMFYACFPLLLIGNNNLSFLNASASVNIESYIVFIATFIPITYLSFRIWMILNLISNYAQKQFSISFHRKKLTLTVDSATDSATSPGSGPVQSVQSTFESMKRALTDTNINTNTKTNTNKTLTKNQKTSMMTSQENTKDQKENKNKQPSIMDEMAPSQSVADLNIIPNQSPMTTYEDAQSMDVSMDTCTLGDAASAFSVRSTSPGPSPLASNETDFKFQEVVSQTSHGGGCCHGPTFLLSKRKLDEMTMNKNTNKKIKDINTRDKVKIARIQLVRRGWLFVFGFALIVYGMSLWIQMVAHTQHDMLICDEYSNLMKEYDGNDNRSSSFLAENEKFMHLYAWSDCSYKVYPLWDEVPCQCRNLYINSSSVESWRNNLDAKELAEVFKSILRSYYMLETFYFNAGKVSLIETLNWDDNMMVSTELKVLDLHYISFFNISASFGLKFSKLEILRFSRWFADYIDFTYWYNMRNLKWLDLIFGALYNVKGLTDWNFCNFKELRSISILGFGHFNIGIDVCESDDELQHLLWIGVEGLHSLNPIILAQPSVRGVSMMFNQINAVEFESQLANLKSNDEAKYNQILNKTIYFQASTMCSTYSYNNTVFGSNYPLTTQLIEVTDACKQVCSTQHKATSCQPYIWQDGICDSECNAKICGYDGGDCTQLCDFSVCESSWLGDGICNPECHNKECSFDYCDCWNQTNYENKNIMSSNAYDEAEYQLCFFNDTRCQINSQCYVGLTNYSYSYNFSQHNGGVTLANAIHSGEYSEDSNYIHSWVGDSICDSWCYNEYCNYDDGDCNECSPDCEFVMLIFESTANSLVQDYKISVDESCHLWSTMETIATEELLETLGWNCTNMIQWADLDEDELVTAYEAGWMLYGLLYRDFIKGAQINCSLCAQSVALYYGYE